MNQKKIGGVIIVLSLLFGVLLFYLLSEFSSESEQLGCTPSQQCQPIVQSINITHFIFGLIAGTLAFGVYMILFYKCDDKIMQRLEDEKNKKLSEDKFTILLKGLDKYEQVVIKSIKEHSGITQSTLRIRTKLSKAKISRVIQQLEDKNLVSKSKSKKTNELFLVDEW